MLDLCEIELLQLRFSFRLWLQFTRFWFTEGVTFIFFFVDLLSFIDIFESGLIGSVGRKLGFLRNRKG